MKVKKSDLQIAIDGPVAAGKGTVGKLLAEKLKILYIDTGAMYRAIAYFLHSQNVNFNNEEAICQILVSRKPQVHLETPEGNKRDGRLITTLLNNEDISWQIRTRTISLGVSIITAYKCVRDYLVPQQQKLASSTSVVMEGRDITTRVLPNADLKVYMDANVHTRARRRYQQLLEKGELVTLEKTKKELQIRDHRDAHRKIDPLTKASDAWVLDTTNLSISEVVKAICAKLTKQGLVQ